MIINHLVWVSYNTFTICGLYANGDADEAYRMKTWKDYCSVCIAKYLREKKR